MLVCYGDLYHMAHPQEIKEKVIRLRKQGYSLNEIVPLVPAVKSTVALWMREVELDATAKERLFSRTEARYFLNAQNRRAKTLALEERYFQEALEEIKSNPNQDKIMCAMLYWCEGAKSAKAAVAFTNSDPKLIKKFVALLRASFDLDERKFRVGIHLHEYHSPDKQLDFWSKITDIDKQQFIKPYLKPHTGKRKRDNYQGCICLRYQSNDLARRLMAIAKAYLYTGA
jgi:hypothetical protein